MGRRVQMQTLPSLRDDADIDVVARAPCGWHSIWISDAAQNELTTAQQVEQGDVIIVMPDVATEAESAQLAGSARECARRHHVLRCEAGLESSATARLPGIAASARAAAAGVVCPTRTTPLPSETDVIVELVLARVFTLIDEQLPSLVTTLLGTSSESHVGRGYPLTLVGLHDAGMLHFSAREPAINVYDVGGVFEPHMDHDALTVLIPLTSPAGDAAAAVDAATRDGTTFSGGGTGFWSPGAKTQKAAQDHYDGRGAGPPTALFRPAAGTALLFGGHTLHAGLPVTMGSRVCLVASFSNLAYDYDFMSPQPRPRSQYDAQ